MPGILTLGQVFGFLLALAIVVVLAIIVTRFVAGQRLRSFRNKNIRIIESIGIGYQSSICILQVGTNYILVGITRESINLLQNINEDDITTQQPEGYDVPFKKYLEKYIRKGEQDDSGDIEKKV